MTIEPTSERRLKFYGLNDFGMRFQVERIESILQTLASNSIEYKVSDIIELHNTQLFIENKIYPHSFSYDQRMEWDKNIPKIRPLVARFFNALNDGNFAYFINDVSWEYQSDLLRLLAKFKVYDRCSANTILPTLEAVDINLGAILENRDLVKRYDHEVRSLILASSSNAEHLIKKHLEDGANQSVNIPASLPIEEQRALLDSYVSSSSSNPNYIELISLAPAKKNTIVDAKLKLKAKRKHQQWTEEFFRENAGLKIGCTLVLDEQQIEPVEFSTSGLISKFSYSLKWFEDSLDYPSILNNFLYVFQFANFHMLLAFPSNPADLGIFERLIGVQAKGAYPLGTAFRLKESNFSLQTSFYRDYLKGQGIEPEEIIAWFFDKYLRGEYDAPEFRFTPSSETSSYLEKCRHLFAEMDSILRQFTIYTEEKELDFELLAITSEPVRFKEIPSLLSGKYAYATDESDVLQVLHLLFSDQSELAYINESIRGRDAVELLSNHRVSYEDFADHQKHSLDFLIQNSVLKNNGQRIVFSDSNQLLVFRSLVNDRVASYYHYSDKGRAVVDELENRGWLTKRDSLFSDSEASYFNYCLNQTEFSNGPDLRNKYMHGSNVDAANEGEHFTTYIRALKLFIAIVIKINDEFWLREMK